jgi:hypothetical protein
MLVKLSRGLQASESSDAPHWALRCHKGMARNGETLDWQRQSGDGEPGQLWVQWFDPGIESLEGEVVHVEDK